MIVGITEKQYRANQPLSYQLRLNYETVENILICKMYFVYSTYIYLDSYRAGVARGPFKFCILFFLNHSGLQNFNCNLNMLLVIRCVQLL